MRISDWSSDVCSSDLARPALVAAQRVKLLNRRRRADIVPQHRDIDVFGEAVDQPESLGQGRSTLEEEKGSALLQAIEQGIQRPADPEVLLDIKIGRASCRERVWQYVSISVVTV